MTFIAKLNIYLRQTNTWVNHEIYLGKYNGSEFNIICSHLTSQLPSFYQ